MPTAFAIRTAALLVRHGAVIAYPTEAVYGLGCDPLDDAAVGHVLDIKQRSRDKGLILIAAGAVQLEPFVAELSNSDRRRIEAPEPVTWLVPPGAAASPLLTGEHDKIAVRVTHHPVARALCLACGHPLVSTSANIAGRQPARTSLAVRQRFRERLDFVLSGAVGELGQPTSIRDLVTGEVLR